MENIAHKIGRRFPLSPMTASTSLARKLDNLILHKQRRLGPYEAFIYLAVRDWCVEGSYNFYGKHVFVSPSIVKQARSHMQHCALNGALNSSILYKMLEDRVTSFTKGTQDFNLPFRGAQFLKCDNQKRGYWLQRNPADTNKYYHLRKFAHRSKEFQLADVCYKSANSQTTPLSIEVNKYGFRSLVDLSKKISLLFSSSIIRSLLCLTVNMLRPENIRDLFWPLLIDGYLSCISFGIEPGSFIIVDNITDPSSLGVSLYAFDNGCSLAELVHGSFVDHYYVLSMACINAPNVCDEYLLCEPYSLTPANRRSYQIFSSRSRTISSRQNMPRTSVQLPLIPGKILVIDNIGSYRHETQISIVERFECFCATLDIEKTEVVVRAHPRLGLSQYLQKCISELKPLPRLDNGSKPLSEVIQGYGFVVFLSETNAWRECCDNDIPFAFLDHNNLIASELLLNHRTKINTVTSISSSVLPRRYL